VGSPGGSSQSRGQGCSASEDKDINVVGMTDGVEGV
jgi:hypothetical protein